MTIFVMVVFVWNTELNAASTLGAAGFVEKNLVFCRLIMYPRPSHRLVFQNKNEKSHAQTNDLFTKDV